MRATFIIAGLMGMAAAVTITLTEVADVTVTQCAPTVTNCPGKAGSQWQVVTSLPAPPATTPVAPADDCTDDDAEWEEWSNASGCPVYSGTAPPTWISQLPPTEYSSMSAHWASGPPVDWCSYSYTTAVVVAPTPSTVPTLTPTAVVGTGGYKASSSSIMPTYTGVASHNIGPVAYAGLAAVAALVLA